MTWTQAQEHYRTATVERRKAWRDPRRATAEQLAREVEPEPELPLGDVE